MRIHRIVAGLIALVMLALLPSAAGSSALAADGGASAAKAASAAAPAAADKKNRKITIHGSEPGDRNKFFIRGKVGPDAYKTKVITVQRKLASERKWKLYKRIKTNAKSAYRTRVAALKRTGKVEYRTVTPPTKKYNAAASNGKIVITSEVY